MKTKTIRVSEKTHKKIKLIAVKNNMTIAELIENLLLMLK